MEYYTTDKSIALCVGCLTGRILEYARGNVNNAALVQHFFLVPSENYMTTVIILWNRNTKHKGNDETFLVF